MVGGTVFKVLFSVEVFSATVNLKLINHLKNFSVTKKYSKIILLRSNNTNSW